MARKKVSLLRFGFVLLLVAVSMSAMQLISNNLARKEQPQQLVSDQATVADPTFHWDTYINDEYGFAFRHPRLLYKQEFKDSGGYLFFVRLEKTQYTQGDGVAVGVSKNSLEEELVRIKNLLEEEGGELKSEAESNLGGQRAVKIEYAPADGNEGEVRAVVILNNGEHSFSISTTPVQIDAVVASLNFNAAGSQLRGMEDKQTFCGGIANVPCPAGFTCELKGEFPDSGGVCVSE